MYVILLDLTTPERGFPKRMWTVEESKEGAQQAICDAVMLFGSHNIVEIRVFEGTEIDVNIDTRTEVTF